MPVRSIYRSVKRSVVISSLTSNQQHTLRRGAPPLIVNFILRFRKMKVNNQGKGLMQVLYNALGYISRCLTKKMERSGSQNPINQNILQDWRMSGTEYNLCAEGGNRTLIPGGNTILSRARLPIPPLRLVGQCIFLSYAPQSIPLITRSARENFRGAG